LSSNSINHICCGSTSERMEEIVKEEYNRQDYQHNSKFVSEWTATKSGHENNRIPRPLESIFWLFKIRELIWTVSSLTNRFFFS